jgi:hypothetical protein
VRLFGKDVRQLAASRVFHAPAKAVLDALAQVWQASPYNLRLLDAVGPHPLDGGAVMFRVPKFTYSADGTVHNNFHYHMYTLSIRQVRLTMQRRGRDAIECTVTVELHETIAVGRRRVLSVDARRLTDGARRRPPGAAMFMTMIPIFAALATVGVVATIYGGLYKLNSVLYAYYIKSVQEHLETLLADVDANLRTQAVFGSLPAPRPALPRGDDGAGGP